MPLPIANFGYLVEDLTVNFTNLSLNIDEDTIYDWQFGDGDSSNLENPTHIYLGEGFYNVTLTVTNGADSNQITVLINTTGEINPNIKIDIPSMIDLYSPSSVVGTIKNNNQKAFLIAKWQEYLRPLMFNPEITLENTHNPSAWPFLVNNLIAKLVVIDIIGMESSSLLLSSATNAESSSNPNNPIADEGAIKMIETGPAKTEFYDVANASESALNLIKAFTSILKPGGVLDELRSSTCQDAQRLRLYLPMCGQLKQVINFKVVKADDKGKYASNPFGITPRMK